MSDTEQLKNRLNNAMNELNAVAGGAKRGRKSTKGRKVSKGGAKSKTRTKSRTRTKSKGKKTGKKGGAKKTKTRGTKSKKTKTKSKKTKSKMSRGVLRPALSENLRTNKAFVKILGYKGAWSGIMKLVKKIKDTVRHNVSEGDHVGLANKTIAAFEDYVEKHGKAKVLAEVERLVEEIRSKRSKK